MQIILSPPPSTLSSVQMLRQPWESFFKFSLLKVNLWYFAATHPPPLPPPRAAYFNPEELLLKQAKKVEDMNGSFALLLPIDIQSILFLPESRPDNSQW